MKLFDAHCHLQDPRILNKAPQIIKEALDKGVVHFAVDGIFENDWQLVKEMSDKYPSVIPNFGIHPWYVAERSPNWMSTLKEFFEANPAAAVGEIGLDKGSRGRQIDFGDQVEVFSQQLQLAKALKRPASIHCVRAFGDMLDVLKSLGPFPSGLVLHSYMGSADLVPEFAKLGAYFSFSGFLMASKESKAKKMVKAVPVERILLETDAPDAFPKLSSSSSNKGELPIPVDKGMSSHQDENQSIVDSELNHPANIHHILTYVASLLDMAEEELAAISYKNAIRLFSFEGSKVLLGECNLRRL